MRSGWAVAGGALLCAQRGDLRKPGDQEMNRQEVCGPSVLGSGENDGVAPTGQGVRGQSKASVVPDEADGPIRDLPKSTVVRARAVTKSLPLSA